MFRLDPDTTSLVSLFKCESNTKCLNNVTEWANAHDIVVQFKKNSDSIYLCEFEIIANTKKICTKYVSELQSILKVISNPVLLKLISGSCRLEYDISV